MIVTTKISGKTTNRGLNRFPSNEAPISAAANTSKNCNPIFVKLSADSTCVKSAAEVSHEKLGLGTTTPNSAKKMIAKPSITTTQSSLIAIPDLEDDIKYTVMVF